jgi:hypothetical protein
MTSCWVISGLVVIALAFISSAVSLVAPYWYHQNPITNMGLWATCFDDQKCTWFYEDDFQWEKAKPMWWKCSQGLFGGGVLLLLLAFLIACIYLCCGCCKVACQSIVHLVNGFLVFAFISLGVGLALFGAKAHEEYRVTYDRSSYVYYEWGYWLGCGGTVLNLIAIFFFTCAGCRSSPHDGYTRGEVV